MKQIQHNIGGQTRTLDFGKMWYLKFAGDFTGKDPLLLTEDAASDPAFTFKYATCLVYAGINSFNKSEKLPLITIEEAEQWTGDMDETEAAELITKYRKCVAPDEQGEVNPQGESPSPGMN